MLFWAIVSNAHAFELPVAELVLDPRTAFVPTLVNGEDALALEWTIAAGYYLYRDKTEIFMQHQQERTRLQPEFAVGEKINDEEFGEQIVYRLATQMKLPTVLNDAVGVATLEITFQGCKEGRLCYPPTTILLQVPNN